MASFGAFETRVSDGDPGRTVVAMAGECDLAVREEMIAVLQDAVDAAPVVVVDLAELTFIDSGGVHALVAARRAAHERGGQLYAVNAVGLVADVLDITGVGELLRPPPQGG